MPGPGPMIVQAARARQDHGLAATVLGASAGSPKGGFGVSTPETAGSLTGLAKPPQMSPPLFRPSIVQRSSVQNVIAH